MKQLLPIAAALAALIGSPPAFAMQLQPLSRVFVPSGSGATQSFEIINDGSERIAVEVSIASLSRDEDYAEINEAADDDFLVYPSQLVLPAGRRQTIRVTWLGDPRPTRELTYRIIVEQLPIELLDNPGAAA